MKSELAKCNTFYWSKRYAEKCYCVGVASFLVDLQFEDISKNGWYHCQEVEPVSRNDSDIIDIEEIRITSNNRG